MIQNRIQRSVSVIGAAITRWDVFIVAVISGGAYLGIYLYAIGNLSIEPGIGTTLLYVDDPIARMLEPGPGRFAYEPVAIIDLWIIRYLFSPINTGIGVGLAVLVGLNFSLSYLAVIQPKACGLGTSSGILTSIPAVLAGSACCAPVIFLLVGVTASGTMLTLVTWLLPIGILLLIVSLVYLTAQINPVTLANQ